MMCRPARAGRLVVAGLDADGRLDLVLVNTLSGTKWNSFSVLLNTATNGSGAADFPLPPRWTLPRIAAAAESRWRTLTDGHPDVAVVGYQTNVVSVFRNMVWQAPQPSAAPNFPTAAALTIRRCWRATLMLRQADLVSGEA